MANIRTRLALASQRAAGQRSFQILGDAELFELAIGAFGNRKLIVGRELAHPDLMALVRSSGLGRFGSDHVEIDLVAAGRTKRAALTALLREEDLAW